MTPDFPDNSRQDLPGAKLVKVLGSISFYISLCAIILLCFGILISIGNGIWALQVYYRDMKVYKLQPENYTSASYNKLRTGMYLAVAGLIISGIEIAVIILNYGKDGLN